MGHSLVSAGVRASMAGTAARPTIKAMAGDESPAAEEVKIRDSSLQQPSL
jgi:hypothetical protein